MFSVKVKYIVNESSKRVCLTYYETRLIKSMACNLILFFILVSLNSSKGI